MQKETTIIHKFTFTPEEAKLLRHALDYCWHRATTEEKIGHLFDANKLDIMRKFLADTL